VFVHSLATRVLKWGLALASGAAVLKQEIAEDTKESDPEVPVGRL